MALKRIPLKDAATRWLALEPFVTKTAVPLEGVTGAVYDAPVAGRSQHVRLYRYHRVSQAYTVLFTVLSGGTVVGWAYRMRGDDHELVRRAVIDRHNGEVWDA